MCTKCAAFKPKHQEGMVPVLMLACPDMMVTVENGLYFNIADGAAYNLHLLLEAVGAVIYRYACCQHLVRAAHGRRQISEIYAGALPVPRVFMPTFMMQAAKRMQLLAHKSRI